LLEQVVDDIFSQITVMLQNIRFNSLKQTASPTRLRVVRGATILSSDKGLLNITSNLLVLLFQLPRQFISRDNSITNGHLRLPSGGPLTRCTLLGVRNIHSFLVDFEHVRRIT